MRNYILSTFFIIGMISTACNYATADSGVSSWFLPLTLSDKNTTIAFTLDSTWHTVQGTTSGVSGLAELQDGEDPTSLHVQVQIPVETFDTDNSMRDSKLRKIMTADKFKTVSFVGDLLDKHCTPALVMQNGTCKDAVNGTVTIRNTTKKVSLPTVISYKDKQFHISGTIPIKWAEYGVEDPSIFIASVDDTVFVSYDVIVGKQD